MPKVLNDLPPPGTASASSAESLSAHLLEPVRSHAYNIGMVGTFEALAVLLVALLPGALYVWSFERLVGAWGIGFSDRVLRFIGTSAVMHALLAPVTFWLWREFVKTGRIAMGDAPLFLWFVVLGYVALPIAAGSFVGVGTVRGWGWTTLVTGPGPAPRAWDYLFGLRPDGWIRLRLKSGTWLGGAYAELEDGRKSYAAGFPHEQDLLLVETAEVDPETGEFLFGQPHSERLLFAASMG